MAPHLNPYTSINFDESAFTSSDAGNFTLTAYKITVFMTYLSNLNDINAFFLYKQNCKYVQDFKKAASWCTLSCLINFCYLVTESSVLNGNFRVFLWGCGVVSLPAPSLKASHSFKKNKYFIRVCFSLLSQFPPPLFNQKQLGKKRSQKLPASPQENKIFFLIFF